MYYYMVCYNHTKSKFQRGNGMIDNLLKPFTVEKYPGEHHSRSLNPNTFLQPMSYNGPGTNIKLREQLHDDKPLNDLDEYAKEHDYAYLHEKEAYEKDHDKQKHINNIHKADDVYIQKAKNSRDEPILGPISSKLIATKKTLEEHGMDTKRFSGFGNEEDETNEITDPVARLKELVQQHYKTEERKSKRKVQRAGVFPLAPIGLAVAGTIASKIASDLYDVLKKRLVGSGYTIKSHKNKKEQILFLKQFVNKL